MKKVLAIGDIHGEISKLSQLLSNTKDYDTIISLGDVMETKIFNDTSAKRCNECLELLSDLNAQLVVGNHDQKFISYLRKGTTPENPEKREYIGALSDKAKKYLLSHKIYIQALIGEKLFTFVHAGISPIVNFNRLSENAINQILRVRYLNKNNINEMVRIKKIDGEWQPEPGYNYIEWQKVYDGRYGVVVHGHDQNKNIRGWFLSEQTTVSPEIYYSHNEVVFKVLSIDTGAAFGNKLTGIIIDKDGFGFKQV